MSLEIISILLSVTLTSWFLTWVPIATFGAMNAIVKRMYSDDK